jgi:hypothetical protein
MADAATAALTVSHADMLDGYAEENPVAQPQTLASVAVDFAGATVTPLITVDAVYNYGPAPEPFTLTISVP